MEFKYIDLWGVILGVFLVAAGFVVEKGTSFFLVIALILSILPFLIRFLRIQALHKEKEAKFLEFTFDLVESVKSGTPISKSISNLQQREYGALGDHIKKLGNQLTLGITLTQALINFAKDTGSKVIARSVGLIAEAEKAGGSIDTVIESVSKSVNQSETLKKERKSAISGLVVQGYIIFIVFCTFL